MKQTVTITLAFLITLCVQAQDFNSSMAEIMKNMKAYTVELVALMPEENFDFRQMDSIRTFHKQVQHMISTNHFLLNHYLKGEEKTDAQTDIQNALAYSRKSSKTELLQILNEQFDANIAFFTNASRKQFKKTYTFGTPEDPQVKDYFTTSMLIRDHISHHRAQLIIYLRLNNIEPPQYAGF
jgi:uncharacterized damage-inducible protein DinB